MPLVRKNAGSSQAAVTREPRATEVLVQELSAADPDVRAAAAVELGEQQKCAREVAERLLVEPEHDVRLALGAALLRAGDRDATSVIAPLLSSDDATLRNEVRELFHGLPGADDTAEVLLNHVDPDVRMFAVEVIASRRGPGANALVAQLAQVDADVNVVCHAVELLGASGTARELAVLELVRARYPEEDYLSFCVDAAMGAIANRSGETGS